MFESAIVIAPDGRLSRVDFDPDGAASLLARVVEREARRVRTVLGVDGWIACDEAVGPPNPLASRLLARRSSRPVGGPMLLATAERGSVRGLSEEQIATITEALGTTPGGRVRESHRHDRATIDPDELLSHLAEHHPEMLRMLSAEDTELERVHDNAHAVRAG